MASTITDPAALRAKTAPWLLCERARAAPDPVAFRSKHRGLYRERRWRDYAALVAHMARALSELGLRSGERVAIMGDACEEWMIADLASQSLGAVTYGIYPTASGAEVEYQMRDGGASIFIAEDQEYVDKVLSIADRLPDLRWVVVIDDAAMFQYAHPKLLRLRALLERTPQPELDWLEERARALSPDDPAFIVYTSGTTGMPKGALVGHGKHLAAAFNVAQTYPTLLEREHRTVIHLPLCHVLGRDVAITLPLFSKLVPHFGEDIEDLGTTLFDVAPTVLFTVPRYLQKFASQILVGIGNSSAIKRAAYDAVLPLAREVARKRWEGALTIPQSIAYEAARALVFRPILNKLGLDQLQLLVSGGASLPVETMTLWQMYGVNVCEMYGQTETAGGIISGQRGPFPRPGNVGEVPPGWQVDLSDTGEILVQSEYLFDGYWRNEDATNEVLKAGHLHTGDVGEWRNGALRLVDRARDFIVTSGGKSISPSFIENLLRASPYVAEALIVGHGRKYLAALIEIDYDSVADWARGQDVPYTGFTDLALGPHTRRLIAEEIGRVNKELARVEQIKEFRILPKALDPEEEGEPVTPTRKVKRMLMVERFKDLVDSMYDDTEDRLVAAGAGETPRA